MSPVWSLAPRSRLNRWSLGGLSILVLVPVMVLGLIALADLPQRAMRQQQAMLDDPTLPFLAWNRAIAQAPDRETRLVLEQTRDRMVGTFEAPYWRDIVGTGPASIVRAWDFLHASPARLFQMLGGMNAYHAAVVDARNVALDEDAQANLDTGRVKRSDVLGQALPSLDGTTPAR